MGDAATYITFIACANDKARRDVHQGGLSIEIRHSGGFQQAIGKKIRAKTCLLNQASAFKAAARRLLWRAALFLWMIFLSAMRSMVDTDA